MIAKGAGRDEYGVDTSGLNQVRKEARIVCDGQKIGKNEYMNAMVKSSANSSSLKKLLKNALTTEIDSREMFMKGIDYSYYYEENN